MSDHAPRIACVWDRPGAPTHPLRYGAHIGTWSLAAVCGYDVVYWANDGQPPSSIDDYDVLLVNLFSGMRHVEQVKDMGYKGKVVAVPDTSFDDVFRHDNPHGHMYLTQLQMADAVGVVSVSNQQLYRGLVRKPIVSIPHPVGTAAFFEMVRSQERQRYILVVGHSDSGHPRPLDYDLPTLAAAGRIQQHTGLPIVYADMSISGQRYCEQLGLHVANYLSHMVYEDYARLSGQAYIGVDMYAIHGKGRNEITWSYAGLPFVAGNYTDGVGGVRFDPWDVESAAAYGIRLVEDRALYADVQYANLDAAQAHFGFDNTRVAMRDTIDRIMDGQSLCARNPLGGQRTDACPSARL